MKKILLATHNRDKAREFQMLLAGLDIEVLTLDAFPQVGSWLRMGNRSMKTLSGKPGKHGAYGLRPWQTIQVWRSST